MKPQECNQLEITPYCSQLKKDWDNFVDFSKNGNFLLKRDYIEYHSHRFNDSSLIISKNGDIHALFPSCRIGNKVFSHAGLTYGGLIMSSKCTTANILEVFSLIKQHLKTHGIEELIYKPIPHIYHTLPSEEDLYAIFRLNGILTQRNVSAVVTQENKLKFRNIRNAGIRKAKKSRLFFKESRDFKSFWQILSDNLMKKYGATPVHSVEEIEKLATLFPDNIRLFSAFSDDKMEAGVVIYVSRQVAHCQYISATPEGKSSGALDFIFDFLLNEVFADKKYFDFGTSNEDGGKILNESLIYQKEGFGARAICYDTYSIPI